MPATCPAGRCRSISTRWTSPTTRNGRSWRNLNFSVPAGKTVAVVGHSGAGKSTLARLLFRFYDVTGGAIRINGHDLRTLKQGSLRAAIGIVPQDTVLFNDSIFYNIKYGRPEASREEVSPPPAPPSCTTSSNRCRKNMKRGSASAA